MSSLVRRPLECRLPLVTPDWRAGGDSDSEMAYARSENANFRSSRTMVRGSRCVLGYAVWVLALGSWILPAGLQVRVQTGPVPTRPQCRAQEQSCVHA